MAKKSNESVPHSWIAMAMPSIIQRWGWSDGMPIGSSGGIPVSRLTFSIYVAVRFSFEPIKTCQRANVPLVFFSF